MNKIKLSFINSIYFAYYSKYIGMIKLFFGNRYDKDYIGFQSSDVPMFIKKKPTEKLK